MNYCFGPYDALQNGRLAIIIRRRTILWDFCDLLLVDARYAEFLGRRYRHVRKNTFLQKRLTMVPAIFSKRTKTDNSSESWPKNALLLFVQCPPGKSQPSGLYCISRASVLDEQGSMTLSNLELEYVFHISNVETASDHR
jgi:hypothetical protein